ncbi:MAG TPA: bifunctional phosphoribosylaminoimidazolecarboxamide formyltransferase/IMP cyclohydrolase [Phycisphaerae bacterium]|nr:bifunctional phosphoribosylaminoimidazolecarboxamide formyltransferase/IMP cyclohydrolase [Phycisphaerae bacterium]HRY66724.1 bifunctional phosphoribosylaminoimidazolecarboxamide formyltransferase/IMP cyclohydrolase [Phycisphaerae bacterium]HSA29026.1 bifunctional phosphoribosylaminoimidazolecarboxamide formyltransferase/IMP cyclohydrolase [Phycisphaerae bacterium]
MSDIQIKRAIIAVYDKTGITDFARALVDEFGIEIISTGGTAKHLKDAGIPVTMVEEVTGFPEMLDGRVKTLHPMIHAGILADRDNPEHMKTLEKHGIKPIDMVVVNLYPFEKTIAAPNCTFEQAIEMIDIGGPCMLRAAAKNHKHVLVLPTPLAQDTALLELRSNGVISGIRRQQFASWVYKLTACYDAMISQYFGDGRCEKLPSFRMDALISPAILRYGENPDQSARPFRFEGHATSECNTLYTRARPPFPSPCRSDGSMSFNNYVDGDSALSLLKEFSRADLRKSAVAFIKHTNACGCAIGDDPVDTYRRAYLGDPIAAAGGVLCMNFPVTREIADMVMNSFGKWGKAAGAAFFKLDVWIAPSFDDDALELITTPTEKRKWGKECRLLSVGPMDGPPDPNELDYKKIVGGMLVQTRDLLGLNEDQWKVVTQRKPTESEMADLRFAWLVCKHTKSNAITICRDGMLLGNGAGQMSRVKSCDLAVQLSRENGHGDKLKGAVAAGDAFFPVPDGPQKLIDAGITAIIHPGGSNRDAETVALCDTAGVAMIITGTRHFKH